MKKSEKRLREISETLSKINGIARHIKNVEDNCLLLGTKLIENGDIEFGKKLIANGFVHDASKFYGIEWDNMAPGTNTETDGAKLKLRLAIEHHARTNSHHPEYWNGIHNMPRIAIAEMVCDWKSRSEEFGTSLREYIENSATKRWKFSKNDDIYSQIMEFVDMLCMKPFESMPKE